MLHFEKLCRTTKIPPSRLETPELIIQISHDEISYGIIRKGAKHCHTRESRAGCELYLSSPPVKQLAAHAQLTVSSLRALL